MNIKKYENCPILEGEMKSSWYCVKSKCPYWIEHRTSGCGLSPMIEGLRKQIFPCIEKELADDNDK